VRRCTARGEAFIRRGPRGSYDKHIKQVTVYGRVDESDDDEEVELAQDDKKSDLQLIPRQSPRWKPCIRLYLYGVNDSETAQDNLLAVSHFVGRKFRQLTERSMTDFVAVKQIVLY
jgi:hypothetical protein